MELHTWHGIVLNILDTFSGLVNIKEEAENERKMCAQEGNIIIILVVSVSKKSRQDI